MQLRNWRRGPWFVVLALSGCTAIPAANPTSTPPAAAAGRPAELAKPRATSSSGEPAGSSDDEPISAEQQLAKIPFTRFQVPIGESPQRGPVLAPVTIVMFSDFECPFCQQGHNLIRDIEAEFPEQIRVVYRAFPISRHPNAMLAALLAASSQARGKFWEFHERLFSGERLSPEKLWNDITALGLPRTDIEQELDGLVYGPTVSADLRLAKKLDVTSTPTFFINGRPVAGSIPLGAFRHLIEQELRVVETLRSRGIKPDAIYTELTRHGFSGVSYEGKAGAELDPDQAYAVPIADSPQLGSATAPVTMVLFTDFECPFCIRGNQVIDNLRARYGTDLRIVFKHLPLPFHPLGQAASRLACVAQTHGKFWAFHDAVMHLDQRLDRRILDQLAHKLNLPSSEVQAALDDQMPTTSQRIAQDLDLAAMLGVTGTPSYFINGRPLTGARDELDFRLVIAEEMQRARELVRQGMAPQQVYEHLTHTGKTP